MPKTEYLHLPVFEAIENQIGRGHKHTDAKLLLHWAGPALALIGANVAPRITGRLGVNARSVRACAKERRPPSGAGAAAEVGSPPPKKSGTSAPFSRSIW